jgi:tetratricopeptide (TPR) repeat protein
MQDITLTDKLNEARALHNVGNTSLALDRMADLQVLLEQTPNTSSLQAQLLHEMGQIYTAKHKLPEAASCLEKSLAKDPAQPVVHYEAGLVYRDMGQPRKAAEHLEAAVAGGFPSLAAGVHLTAAYFASRQSAAGLARAKLIIATQPKSSDVTLRLGRMLFDRLYYTSALEAFQLAHRNAPEALDPWFYLALTHFVLKQYPDAIRVLSAPPHGAAGPETANLLAASTALNGDIPKAARQLSEAIRQWPQSPHAYLNLALLHLEQDKQAEAEALLNRFQALGTANDAKVFYTVQRNACATLAAELSEKSTAKPQHADFYFNLASQLQDRYHFTSSVELLRLLHRQEGNTARLLYAAGRDCLNLSPQSPEPVTFLKQAVVQDPTHHEAWHLLGRAQLRAGNSDDAIAALRKAWALHPRAEYALSLGKALPGTADATALFRQAFTLEPSNALARYELGHALLQAGQFEEARQHLLKAVDLEPDFYECYYLLMRLCSQTGDKVQSQKYALQFEQTKQALAQQSVIGSGYVNEGRRQ